ncbi:DUF222 domain-containing protein [Geodermatophilus sp. URMC 64]
MNGVLTALEERASDDLHAQSSTQLLERTRGLVEVINRAQAELARTVRTADSRQVFAGDGMATAQSWLRGHCRLSGAAAAQVVRNGRALEQLPAVAAAHAAGELTADQVAVIARITGPRAAALIVQRDGDLAGIAGVLARFAAGHKHEELVRLVHTLLERLDEDGPEPDPTEERFLSFAKHADGSGTGRFHLDALGMEKLQAAIESILQAHRPAGDERTRSQQQADALVQLCDIHLGCGTLPLLRTVKPHVAVKIGSADLADPEVGRGAASLGFGGVVSAARARQVACDAELRRYLRTAEGELLDLGRAQRLVTPGLRTAVELRDETCVFAGCGAPHHWCEVHHVIHWLFGGETDLENSGLLCERHHTQVHHGFRIERDTAGRWHTYRPDGTEILVIRPPADDPRLARAG